MASSSSHQPFDDDLTGFSIAPKPDCPHVASASFAVHPSLAPTTAAARPSGKAAAGDEGLLRRAVCADCGNAAESWVCLRCARSACGRYVHGHMAQHAVDQRERGAACHPVVALGLADLSVWCFACDAYVTHPRLEPVFREMHFEKFGEWPAAPFHVRHEPADGPTITLAAPK